MKNIESGAFKEFSIFAMMFQGLVKNRKLKYLLKILLFTFLIFLMLNLTFPLKVNIPYSKTIVDDSNEILHSFLSEDDKWRMFAELEEISPQLKRAITFKEDKYFYWHFGVNPFALSRALFNNVVGKKRTSGASTITMQVARLIEPKERTYIHKIVEMFRAVQLEMKFSKEEILQLYLNLVPYGGNIEGVKSAANLYLGKQANHLSLAEITALSIIPNRPNSLLPGKNNALIMQERNKWLQVFYENNVFEKKEIEDALSEEFQAKRRTSTKKAPQFSLRMKNKFPEKINIRTTINASFQNQIEKIGKNFIRTYKNVNINNASIIVIDNQSMEVKTYVGSTDFFDDKNSGEVDGVNSIRQPGSTLKPILYGLAIDKGWITPKTVITDVPIDYDGYAPVNFNKKYNGYVSIEYALAQSLNVPAVKLLDILGIENFLETLVNCQFKSIERQQQNLGLSVILGGCGTTLEELTTMYCTFSNNGKFNSLKWLQDEKVDSSYTVFSEQSNFMVSEMLTNLERPDLPNSWRNTKNLAKIAWKTGTSYGRKDAWSIGFNDKYTVGVWLGNFSGIGVPEMTGAAYATPLLFHVFNTIDEDHSKSWLKKPKKLDIRTVCSNSGEIPGERCTNTDFDYFIPLVSSNKTCTHLSQVYISENDSMSYCFDCIPSSGYKKLWLENHPPEIISFFESENIGYEKLPSHNPLCEHIPEIGAPIISSPKSGTIYYLDEKYSDEILLTCKASKDVSKIFWYINDVFYKSTLVNESVFFKATEGKVKISCSDDLGRNSNIWIDVKEVSL